MSKELAPIEDRANAALQIRELQDALHHMDIVVKGKYTHDQALTKQNAQRRLKYLMDTYIFQVQ